MAWLVGQAMINIGAVLQLIPITGVPLPAGLLRRVVAAAHAAWPWACCMSFARAEAAGGGRSGAAAAARGRAHRGEAGDAVHVVLAGGGTAGHIEPALNLADALRRQRPGGRDHRAGHRAAGWRPAWCPQRGYDLALIPAVPLPRTPVLGARAAARARAHAGARGPRRAGPTGADVVVGFGGYVALPAYLAARRARCPS